MKSKKVTLPFVILKTHCVNRAWEFYEHKEYVFCGLKLKNGPCEARSCPLLKEDKKK